MHYVTEPLGARLRHDGPVGGALLLPEGKRALSWSDDRTLRLWNLEKGQLVGAPLTGHENAVGGALLLEDGNRALSWSSDRTFRLWDLGMGQSVGAALTGHEDMVDGVLLLPDAKQALSWSWDRTLRLFDLKRGQQVGDPLITGHGLWVIGALVLPGGKQALSWSGDGTVRLWDLSTSKEVARFYAEGRVQTLVERGTNRFFAGDGTDRVYLRLLPGTCQQLILASSMGVFAEQADREHGRMMLPVSAHVPAGSLAFRRV